MPSTHSELPPSSADKWLQCHAWRRLNAGLVSKSNAAADQGTLAHSHLEKSLREAYPLPEGFSVPVIEEEPPPKPIRGKKTIPITPVEEIQELGATPKDMADHLETVMDWLQDEHGTVCAELRMDFGSQFGFEGLTGTSDVVIVSPQLLTIGDLKYGLGVVEVTENPQLMVYLSAAVAFFGKRPLYRLVVMQPRAYHKHGPIRDFWVTNEELDEFNAVLEHAIRQNYSPTGKAVPGDWCRHWCKALPTCEAVQKKVLEVFKNNPIQPRGPKRVASRGRGR